MSISGFVKLQFCACFLSLAMNWPTVSPSFWAIFVNTCHSYSSLSLVTKYAFKVRNVFLFFKLHTRAWVTQCFVQLLNLYSHSVKKQSLLLCIIHHSFGYKRVLKQLKPFLPMWSQCRRISFAIERSYSLNFDVNCCHYSLV